MSENERTLELLIVGGGPAGLTAGMYATGGHIKAGDHIYYTSSGGGGFGDPLERDPQLVLDDVMDEWLTIETAKKYYGVVIEEIDAEACEYRINEDATVKAREE